MKQDHYVEEMEAARGRIQQWYDRALGRAGIDTHDPHGPLSDTFDEFRATLEELECAEEELRQQYEELIQARAHIEAERQRYQELFDLAPDAYFVTDMESVIREANRAANALLQVPSRFLISKPLLIYLSENCRQEFDATRDRMVRQGTPAEWIVRVQPRRVDAPKGARGSEPPELVAAVTIVAVRDPKGQPVGLRWLLRDITDRMRAVEQIHTLNATLEARVQERTRALEVARKTEQQLLVREQAARAQAEAAQRRFAFLSEASAMLVGSLDYETTLATVARLALPQFADWCTVDILDEEGELRLVASAHVDPAKEEMARVLRERYPPQRDLAHGIWNVMQTGHAVVIREVVPALWAADACDAEHLEMLQAMNTGSFLRVPLSARGQTLGVLSVGYEGDRRRYGSNELGLIEELAQRAAVAVENARLYREAKVANAAKDRFLAVLSHELRTPLTPIQATAELLRRVAENPERVRAAADVLERNVRLQANLVNDLLDISRITQGRIRLERDPTFLGDLIRETLGSLHETVMEAGLTLAWEIPAEELCAEVDPFRLQQVLLNLVHNAIKYTPRGGQITVALTHQKDEAHLSVADTGVGIAPDALSRIFRIFQQEESGAERKGLGIGLALVSSLVEQHGGRVWAESEGVGHGSRFVVALPLCPPPEQRSPRPVKRSDVVDRGEVGLTRPPGSASVLLVEDNPDSREAIREVLEILGYTVRETCCAEDALVILEKWRPDLILSDIGLPGQSGLDLIRQVRQQRGLEEVGALAITGYGTDADREEALSAGFDAHVVKPIILEELDREMHALLRDRAPA